MAHYYCHACYAKLVWCKSCATRHCKCSWNTHKAYQERKAKADAPPAQKESEND